MDGRDHGKTRIVYKTGGTEHGKTLAFYKTEGTEHGKTCLFYERNAQITVEHAHSIGRIPQNIENAGIL